MPLWSGETLRRVGHPGRVQGQESGKPPATRNAPGCDSSAMMPFPGFVPGISVLSEPLSFDNVHASLHSQQQRRNFA
jgi:hypothetical protein